MENQQFDIHDLDNMQLEELTDLWEEGKLSPEMKDRVITRIPLLKYVRKQEIENNKEDTYNSYPFLNE